MATNASWLAGFGVSLLLSAAVAAQTDDLQVFQARIEAAQKQMDQDPAAALRLLDELAPQSLERRRSVVLSNAERDLHRTLFLTRARGHLLLLDNEAAKESLREVLRLSPGGPEGLAPLERELAEQIQTGESGFLEVVFPEPGFEISVNGYRVGLTAAEPSRFSLVAGEYQLRLTKPGYQPAVGRVMVTAGEVTVISELTAALQVPPVLLVTDQPGVQVLVDGTPVGDTKPFAALRDALPGTQQSAFDQAIGLAGLSPTAAAGILIEDPPIDIPLSVSFRKDCYVDETRSIAVTTEALQQFGATAPLLWFGEASSIRMQPNQGTLRVVSNPAQADVYVDDELVGRTPFERQICAGLRRVRVRNAVGSFDTSAPVVRNQVATVEAVLRPAIAFVGAAETVDQKVQPSASLSAQLARALSAAVSTLQPVVAPVAPDQAWSLMSAAELVAAADRGDSAELNRLLKHASASFGAPLLVAGVRRSAGGDAEEPPVDLLVFWTDHEGVDRVRWVPSLEPEPRTLLTFLDQPLDARSAIYQNVLGVEAVETSLPDARLLVVRVDEGSAGAATGLVPGDVIEAVDGTTMTGTQLAQRIREKRPGEVVELRVVSGGAAPRLVQVPVQQVPARAPVFDPSLFGNALIAKLVAASLTPASASEGDLVRFSLGLAYMRFGEWRKALEELQRVGSLPVGIGVGPGALLYFRARCHEELGDSGAAIALYKEASQFESQRLLEDGGSVGLAARRRVAVLESAQP